MIPPRRILAAVDFSLASRAALAFASSLAGKSAAELHVLHALDPALARAAETLGTDLVGRTRVDLELVTRSVCASQRRRLLHVVIGEAAPVICDIALREQADMVVVGSHGRSYGATGHCGTTAEAVVRSVTLPTVFVPELWYPPGTKAEAVRLGPVIAAVDGHRPSIVAAHAAAALATLLETRLELIHVGDRAAALPQPTRVRLESGDVVVALADAAVPGDETCPILVMGRRTHADGADLPGSTVAGVISAARVPVLMYLPED
jgi:nucleotide-binding universal stress UspA family protein